MFSFFLSQRDMYKTISAVTSYHFLLCAQLSMFINPFKTHNNPLSWHCYYASLLDEKMESWEGLVTCLRSCVGRWRDSDWSLGVEAPERFLLTIMLSCLSILWAFKTTQDTWCVAECNWEIWARMEGKKNYSLQVAKIIE